MLLLVDFTSLQLTITCFMELTEQEIVQRLCGFKIGLEVHIAQTTTLISDIHTTLITKHA
jgi:hypothetical protein